MIARIIFFLIGFGLSTIGFVFIISYLNLITIGYTLPESWMKRCGLGELRLFASGENLFTWTNYSGLDPEVVDIRTGIDEDLPIPWHGNGHWV